MTAAVLLLAQPPARLLPLHHHQHHRSLSDINDDDTTSLVDHLYSSSAASSPSSPDFPNHQSHHRRQSSLLLRRPLLQSQQQHQSLAAHLFDNNNTDHESRRAVIAANGRSSDFPGLADRQRQRVVCLSLPSPIASSTMADAACVASPSSHRSIASTAEETATGIMPDSPPGLSDEKSSKSSSSLHSDSDDMSDGGGSTTEKSSNYDTVTIGDAGRDSFDDSNLKPESRPTLKRPAHRNASPVTMRKMSAPNVLRDPAHAYENRYPKPMGVLRDQSLNLPGGRSLRRGFTSPSTPSLSSYGIHPTSSRSPSPTKPFMRNGVSVSPHAMNASTTSLSSDDRSPGTPTGLPIRPLWHPRRKSVRELEDECNNDDDEVPDGTILENVPITPMPGGVRTPRLSSRSNTPSPQRRGSAIQAHAGLHSANVPKNAKRPSASRALTQGQYGSPRSPRHTRPPMLSHSATFSTFSNEPLSRKHRSKSWTEDLNEEARQLSAALEDYADQLSTEQHGPGSGANSASNSPPRPKVVKQRAMTNITELPLVQRGSVMIDPLPISKEKEAVLTRTRPSWLPPKSQKEERKHLREWEQMMARAAENEKKRASKALSARTSRNMENDSIARIWDQHVLPNWDQVIQEPRTRELWWRGVTPRSRGVVWQKAIGNDLELTPASFSAALDRAVELEAHLATLAPADRSQRPEAAWFDAISRDVPTVIQHPSSSLDRSAFETSLAQLLKAYIAYQPNVGYVTGLHRIAALLLQHIPGPLTTTFITLANLLNRPFPRAYLTNDTVALDRARSSILDTLGYKFPLLYARLTSPTFALHEEPFLDSLVFGSLFLDPRLLSSDCSERVWDLYVFENDKLLVRTAVAVLGRLENVLLRSGKSEILALLSGAGSDASSADTFEPAIKDDAEEFIAHVREAGKVGVGAPPTVHVGSTTTLPGTEEVAGEVKT